VVPGADDDRGTVIAKSPEQILAGALSQLPVVMVSLKKKYDMVARANAEVLNLRVHDLLQVLLSIRSMSNLPTYRAVRILCIRGRQDWDARVSAQLRRRER
jgi:hypothetical protein